MDRTIKYSDLRDAVNQAYEANKSVNEGQADARVNTKDTKAFAISVALADGTVINKGDTTVAFPLGRIVRLPIASVLMSQNGVDMLVKKSGVNDAKAKKPGVSFGAKGIRAVSAIEPTGDPESKWNLIENRMIDLIGSAPQLDINLYETLKKDAAAEGVEEKLQTAGFYLYDKADLSIDLYLKAMSMTVNTQQLAEMGATVVADGVNPLTRKIVYDGIYSQHLIGMMAKSSKKIMKPWLIKVGLPALGGFGGGILAILPGVMSIAAYSPELSERGASVKAAKAIADIAAKLQLSAFASARVVIEK